MTNLNVPNSITNGTTADATDVQQNFDAIESHVNTEVVNRDGSIAMTGELLLPSNPTNNLGASTKSYVDLQVGNEESARITAVSDEASARASADSTLQANIDALTGDDVLVGGTLTWDGPIVGTTTIASGKAAYVGQQYAFDYFNWGSSYIYDLTLMNKSPSSFFRAEQQYDSIVDVQVAANGVYVYTFDQGNYTLSGVGATTGNTYDLSDLGVDFYLNGGGNGTIEHAGGRDFGLWHEYDNTSNVGLFHAVWVYPFNATTEDINVTITFTNGFGTLKLRKLFEV